MALGTPAHGVGNCRTLRLREAWDPVLSDHLERPCLSTRRFELVFSARAQHPWEAQNPGRGPGERPDHFACSVAVSHTVSKPVSVRVANPCDLQIVH